jgi:isopenicillin-N epimerase
VPSVLSEHWNLDPSLAFLNHGAFGACPRPVLAVQSSLRERMERDPIRFLYLELEGRLDDARRRAAAFVDAAAEDFVFVSNATTGVNSVLASFPLRASDEVLVTSHGYPACRNAAEYWAHRAGARVVEVELPFPVPSADALSSAVLAGVGARTRLALIDHVTSSSALVLPVRELVSELRRRGVATLVDGAHAPGMLELSVREIGADYYVGNFHKWCCAPKSSAMLVARAEQRAELRPLVISHGHSAKRPERPRSWLEFDWVGTTDPTAALSVPAALDFLEQLAGSASALFRRNHALAVEARELLCAALGTAPSCPEAMLGSMASVRLPKPFPAGGEALYRALLDRYQIQVPVVELESGSFSLRVSAHLYNSREDYERLALALAELGVAA